VKKNVLRPLSVAILLTVAVIGFVGCRNKNQDLHIDHVIITLTQEAIDSGKTYTIADFSEIELLRIEQLSAFNYQQFALYLKKPSKKNVFKAVELLNKRDDIQLAALSYGTVFAL